MTLTKNDLIQIRTVVKDEIEPLARDLKDVKTRVKKIEKNVDVMARLFDAEDVKLAKRVSKIEEHLGLPSKN